MISRIVLVRNISYGNFLRINPLSQKRNKKLMLQRDF